jgi:hypothetical protein
VLGCFQIPILLFKFLLERLAAILKRLTFLLFRFRELWLWYIPRNFVQKETKLGIVDGIEMAESGLRASSSVLRVVVSIEEAKGIMNQFSLSCASHRVSKFAALAQVLSASAHRRLC